MWDRIEQKWHQLQFNRKLQQAFLEDVALLVEDGVSVTKAIDTLVKVATGPTKVVAGVAAEAIGKGKLLADGLVGWFNPAIIEIIRAGELGGDLARSLRAAANSLTQTNSIWSILINSLAYPVVVLGLALGLTVFLKYSVLSSFATIRPVAQWPAVGQNLYHLASIVEHAWWVVLLIMVLLVILTHRVLHNATGPGRRFIDKMPLLSFYRDAAAARVMETLGLLITNGVMLKKALEIMQRDAEPYLAWHLLMMQYRLSGGKENIAEVLDTELIREHDLLRLQLVAQGKGFEHALIKLGRRAQERNAKSITLTGRLLGGILLGLTALIAMTVVFGIYTIGSMLAV